MMLSEQTTKIAAFVICIILIILIIVLLRMSYNYRNITEQIEAQPRENTFTNQELRSYYSNLEVDIVEEIEEDNPINDYDKYNVESEEYQRLYAKVKLMEKINQSYENELYNKNNVTLEDTNSNDNKSKEFISKGEKECKRSVEKLLGVQFKKVRPNFLKYKTGRNLELDMYNEELKIAVEYNGKQHYEYTPIFHKSEQDFINLIERDEFKKDICDKENITLIIVPYTIKEKDIEKYIESKLIKSGNMLK